MAGDQDAWEAAPGASIVDDFLTEEDATALLAAIDRQPWRDDLSRRVQHYGWIYDYRRRRIDASMWLGPLPGFLAVLADRMLAEKLFVDRPDQAIVNEYLPGQGIAAHVDCVPCFGPQIASLTLGSATTMSFGESGSGRARHVRLRTGSALVLDGPARTSWTHEIRARRSDVVDGVRVPRGRRVSVTFRTVLV